VTDAGPLLAVSIDLDGVEHYAALHGRGESLPEAALDAVPARAAARFGALCRTLGIPGTLFAIGRDVEEGRGAPELRAALADGHELASHSYAHDYALSRRPTADVDADLARASRALAALGSPAPHGFRAPGYTLSAELVDALEATGAPYDSSRLASPPYYAAKAAVAAAMALRGRRSATVFGPVRDTLAPRRAVRLRPGLVELPVAVLPGVRVPFIGTLMVLAPEAATRLMARTLAADPLVVVELHGVDLCGPDDGLPPLQPDLRLPAAVKVRRLEKALRGLLALRRAVTLRDAARLATALPGG